MPCGFHLAETDRRVGEDADADAWIRELGAVRRGQVFALDGSAYFSRPGRASSTASSCSPRSSTPTRSSRSRRPAAGPPVDGRLSRCRSQASFDCLWCGRPTTTRSRDDLEGWAQLCPDCLGKAGDNGFLRFRLHRRYASEARRRPTRKRRRPGESPPQSPAAPPEDASPRPRPRMVEYYEARAPEYDDWYLRRGRYERGAIHDAAWNAELDAAGRWLDALPWAGEIVELAAGTGWWSPLLASQRRAVAVRRVAGGAGSRPRTARRARPARPPPRPRRVGRARPRRSTACSCGFWLSHVPRERARPTSWPRPALAQARRHVRVHRFAGRSAFRARPTIRSPPTTSRSGGWTTAASSRSSRSSATAGRARGGAPGRRLHRYRR